MERKHTVFLTIIAIATLLVAVVGATFAYFSVSVSGTGVTASSQIVIRTANVGITYDKGTDLVLGAGGSSGVVPGATGTMTFTVQNTGDVAMTYNILWANVANTFDAGHPEELKYTLVGSGGGTNVSATNMPANGTTPSIASSVSIAPGATHSYTLTGTFVEMSSAQNYNQSKSFSGKIEVTVNAVSQ